GLAWRQHVFGHQLADARFPHGPIARAEITRCAGEELPVEPRIGTAGVAVESDVAQVVAEVKPVAQAIHAAGLQVIEAADLPAADDGGESLLVRREPPAFAERQFADKVRRQLVWSRAVAQGSNRQGVELNFVRGGLKVRSPGVRYHLAV